MDPDPDESAYDLFQRGTRLLTEHHAGAAAVVLERCLALEPGKASILEALGRAYYEQGDHARAAERFGAIVEGNPLADYALFGLGLAQVRLGDAAAGRRNLRMAAFLKPENEDYQRALRRAERAR
jgi:tetratricopeptide (TPR) repeat protein